MGALMTDNYLDLAAAKERVAETKRLTKAAVAKHYRGQHAGDPIEMAIAERGVVWEPPETAEPFKNDVCGSPSESLNLAHYGRVLAERERLRRQAI